MAIFKHALLSAACISLTACSTHPLPEDYSGTSTKDLVQYLRCELALGVASLKKTVPNDLDQTVVGVDLKLNMDETNNASGGKLALLDPLSGGKFTLDLSGAAEKSRSNERNVRIIDTFTVLKRIAADKECNQQKQRANFLYPISGRIGVGEVVVSYWDVKGLTTYNPNTSAEGAAFSDKLVFKTKLSAGLKPTISITSGPAHLHLSDFSIDGQVVREDKHQLTITLATLAPTKDSEKPNKAASDKGSKQTGRVRTPGRLDSFTVEEEDEIDDGAAIRGGSNAAVDAVVRQLNIQRYRDDQLRSLRELQLQAR